MRLVHATVGVLSYQMLVRILSQVHRLFEHHVVEQHSGHFQIQVGQLSTRVGVGDDLAINGRGKLDPPHDSRAEGYVPAKPYSASTCCTCVTVACVVIIAWDQFFDMCWPSGQMLHHVSEVEESGSVVSHFAESDDAWVAFEGLVDGGE
jgi:hypothetical protein